MVDGSRDEVVAVLLNKLFHLMKAIHRDIAVEEPPLSPPQARIFFTIADYGDEGVTVKDLAEKTSVTPGAITQFVNTLYDKGLVKREADPDDRRMVRLTLTEQARGKAEKMHAEFLSAAKRTFKTLSDDELRQMVALIDKTGAVTGCPHNNPPFRK